MRVLLTLCLGLAVIVLQVLIGVKAFFPEAYVDKTDTVDAILEQKKPIVDQLSKDQLAWIADHPVLYVGVDPHFYPLETFDERGHYVGLAADYARILSKLTGMEFQVRRTANWAGTVKLAQEKKVDIYMAAAQTGTRVTYMTFTEPYINMPGVIMTHRGTGMEKVRIDQLNGKKVVVAKNYSWHDFLSEQHPEIEAVPVETTLEGLQKLANGEVDAIIDYEFNLQEKIKAGGILQVENAGSVDSSYGHGIAVRSDWPELLSIIKLAMGQITPAERQTLESKWIEGKKPAGQERRLQWIFFFVVQAVLFILLFMGMARSRTRRMVKERTRRLKIRLARMEAQRQKEQTA